MFLFGQMHIYFHHYIMQLPTVKPGATSFAVVVHAAPWHPITAHYEFLNM